MLIPSRWSAGFDASSKYWAASTAGNVVVTAPSLDRTGVPRRNTPKAMAWPSSSNLLTLGRSQVYPEVMAVYAAITMSRAETP